MIHKYSSKVIEKYPEIFDTVQNSYLKQSITYCINSDLRLSIKLKNWLNDHINTSKVQEISSQIIGNSYDELVLNCLKYVNNNLKYVSDVNSWNTNEYWQAPDETLNRMKGDCEDGAILMYALCRAKGIPSNRLLLMCGDVEVGGHCWLAYKPEQYPLNFVFLDWCYYYNASSIEYRNFFTVIDNDIIEETLFGSRLVSKYKKLWFAYNEETSIVKYKYNLKNR